MDNDETPANVPAQPQNFMEDVIERLLLDYPSLSRAEAEEMINSLVPQMYPWPHRIIQRRILARFWG
jgi:hypothetical protein